MWILPTSAVIWVRSASDLLIYELAVCAEGTKGRDGGACVPPEGPAERLTGRFSDNHSRH
jgi:hypothetical protein